MKRELLPLDVHISRLLKWLEKIHPLPTWHRQLILDTHHPDVRYEAVDGGVWCIKGTTLKSVADYAERFEALLHRGYSWVNLSVYGLWRGDLVFGIELPQEPVGVPPGYTSVNYSGPSVDVTTREPNWGLQLRIETD